MTSSTVVRLSAVLSLVSCLHAQTGIAIKTRTASRANKAREATAAISHLNAQRWHWLVIFPGVPGPAELALLEGRLAHVVQYLPPRGLIAVAESAEIFSGLPIESLSRLTPDLKISPLLVQSGILAAGTEEQYVMVEYYSDISQTEMSAIVATEGVEELFNPNLLSWQMLVRGKPEALARLAAWDEVAYLFPASDDVVRNNSVVACPGALTSTGMIGQIVATVGDGWDGPGMGAASLSYVFSSYTGRIAPDKIRSELLRAMAEWSKAVKVTFLPGNSANDRQTINILFATGDHGDGYPFDASSKLLAHTFYPAPPNPEPIAGDLHFNDDVAWAVGTSAVGTNYDLFSVALHELGHSLGLGHSDNPGAVMYPYYKQTTALSPDDIAAIQSMYASAVTTAAAALSLQISESNPPAGSTSSGALAVSGTSSGGSGAGQVRWTNSQGAFGTATGWRPWSIAAIPLQTGDNVVVITATDTLQATASQTLRITRKTTAASPPPPPAAVMTLQVLSPPPGTIYRTGERTVVISGTAGPDGKVDRINWVNGSLSGGSEVYGSTWSTSPITLDPGTNSITVMAVDSSGKIAASTVAVENTAVSTPPTSGPDRTAPSLSIASPSTPTFATNLASVTITGTAGDNVAVTGVSWTSSTNTSGIAAGTTNWRIYAPLAMGPNVILIEASDAVGNFSWRSLTVTRQ